MKMIIGGAVAFLLGIFTIIIFSASFFDLVLGVVPVTLILAGGLMMYLNREILLPNKDQEPQAQETVSEEPVDEEPVIEDPPVAEEPVVETPVVEETVIEVPPAEEFVPEEPVIETPAAQEFRFVGNTESKIFHTQDCNFAQGKKCTDFFATTQDAVQAGYKPCSRCNP
ncbi:MAG: hypothetical protein KKE62_05280 [Proteobacteria bacterium]|nr:hypothetical protein [Pseudomonadota bacterium]MBU1388860.1 hypothetical protein [Pseudomonadota bacterium]MBU1542241.1 hypothetical protein [Pseudomonadota bacterium]MBU2429348.1 hypothetical protein [Pseudomonadota bacterium]MBU2480469.1 hypothetical protein [Pseudomonadota bacterium]